MVDEVIVKLNPLLLGGGVALAPGLTAALPLSLRSTKVHASGVVVLRYAIASSQRGAGTLGGGIAFQS